MAWSKLSRHDRGYGAHYQRLRRTVLKLVNGKPTALCVHCLKAGRITVSQECDHIIPKANGGADELDNLQALCKACHTIKTDAEAAEAQGRTVKPRICRPRLTFDSQGRPIW